jgi:hypothetical protein
MLKIMEIPPSAEFLVAVEEHSETQHRIRIEFYTTATNDYFVWPYVRQYKQDSDTMKHFPLRKHFPTMAVARQTALDEGRALIAAGFDVDTIY